MIGHTKDEKFLMALYEIASEKGDLYGEYDKYAVGSTIGLHAKGVETITNLLAQANFIKKRSGAMVALTAHGESLVEKLLNE